MRFGAAIAILLGLGAALVAQTERFTVAQGFAVTPGFVVAVAPDKPKEKADTKKPWRSPVECPDGVEAYAPTGWTQSISILNNRDVILRVRVRGLEKKWHQSGGMEGVEGFKSEKFRLIPRGQKVKTWIGDIAVKNSLGYFQNNRGIKREYPNGTRFDDVLTNTETGEVFEHRTRTKEDGVWYSEVSYKNEAARPRGYTGLKVTCGSCHGEAGTGKYDAGLVPGGDGNLSEPLDWSLVPQAGVASEPEARAPVQQIFPQASFAGDNCPT